MECATHSIRIPSESDEITVYFLGDIHSGSGNFNEPKLKKTVKQIQETRNALWVGMGDYADHVYYTDHRYSPNAVAEVPDLVEFREGIMGQVRKVAGYLEPIKDKCIGLLTGNHEEKMVNKYNVDPSREMSYILKTKWLGYCSLARVYVYIGNAKQNRYSFVIFAGHGYGGGRMSGAKIHKIEQAPLVYDADIYAMGHVHGLVSSKLELTGITGKGKEYSRQRVFVVTSSYLKNGQNGTINYSEKAMYPQAPASSPLVIVGYDKHENKMELKAMI